MNWDAKKWKAHGSYLVVQVLDIEAPSTSRNKLDQVKQKEQEVNYREGIVYSVGPELKEYDLKKGDRVIISMFTISSPILEDGDKNFGIIPIENIICTSKKGGSKK